MWQLLRKIHIAFVIVSVFAAAHCVVLPMPEDNPVARYKLKWTDGIKSPNVAIITEYQGSTLERRLDKAQAAIDAKGGGARVTSHESRATIFILHFGIAARNLAP